MSWRVQHCWDNECHNGTLCICEDKPMCNNPDTPTSSPHPVTPGSGLDCWYGEIPASANHTTNLTKQSCEKHQDCGQLPSH